MHSELSSLSNSKSKCCSIQYLFCKELETLIFTNTFIGFSKNRIKWLASSSVVTGCIRRYCKRSYIYLEITHREFWLLYHNHALFFSIDSDLTENISKGLILTSPVSFFHYLQTTNVYASSWELSIRSYIIEFFSFQWIIQEASDRVNRIKLHKLFDWKQYLKTVWNNSVSETIQNTQNWKQ